MSDENLWLEETKTHIKVGLTPVAQDTLGSVTFAMLPKVGSVIKQGDAVVELEAEKAVVEYESPVSGVVSEINEAAEKNPSLLDEKNAWLYIVEK